MERAVDFIYEIPKFTTKNSLDHTRQLMGLLGDPGRGRRVIHVAGSNGKGSVCCFLYSMLLAAGKSAALFTSPHLTDIRERFQVNGELVSEQVFFEAFGEVKDASAKLVQKTGRHPTFFEFLFAMGMVIYEKADVEYIVLETGLGGRLDATNSFSSPLLTLITSISLEHTEYLGDTIREIAGEKAGILKPGVPVFFDAGDPEAEAVIRARAAKFGCPCTGVLSETAAAGRKISGMAENRREHTLSGSAGADRKMFQICEITGNHIDFSLFSAYDKRTEWSIPFSAPYQAQNAALAVAAMQSLGLMEDAVIQKGLLASRWPGRMQEVRPGIYLDGAHNPAGISAFLDAVKQIVREDPYPPLLLFSMVKGKDIETSAAMLTGEIPWEAIAVSRIPDDRGMAPGEILEIFQEDGRPASGYEDCREALRAMCGRRKPGQKLFCTGSLYFIGALMELLQETEP